MKNAGLLSKNKKQKTKKYVKKRVCKKHIWRNEKEFWSKKVFGE